MSGSSSSPYSSDSAACQAALDRIAATVAVASALATSARPVTLSGLDRDLGRVCAQLLDLPPADGTALRPTLLALETSLVNLTAAVRGRRPAPTRKAGGRTNDQRR